MGNDCNKEIGKLIDVTELYSDEVFNKYLEINNSPVRQKTIVGLSKSRLTWKNDPFALFIILFQKVPSV